MDTIEIVRDSCASSGMFAVYLEWPRENEYDGFARACGIDSFFDDLELQNLPDAHTCLLSGNESDIGTVYNSARVGAKLLSRVIMINDRGDIVGEKNHP